MWVRAEFWHAVVIYYVEYQKSSKAADDVQFDFAVDKFMNYSG